MELHGPFFEVFDLLPNLIGVGGVRGESEVGLQVVDRLGSAARRPQRLGAKISDFTAETQSSQRVCFTPQ